MRYNDKKGWKEEENNVSKSGQPDYYFYCYKEKKGCFEENNYLNQLQERCSQRWRRYNDDDDNDDDNDDKDDNNDKNDNDDGDDDDDGDDEDNDDDGKVI